MHVSYRRKSAIFPHKRALCGNFLFRYLAGNVDVHGHLNVFVKTFISMEPRNVFLNYSQTLEFSHSCVRYVYVGNQLDTITFHFGLKPYAGHKNWDWGKWSVFDRTQHSFKLMQDIKLELKIAFILGLNTNCVTFLDATDAFTHSHDVAKRNAIIVWVSFILLTAFKFKFVWCYVDSAFKWLYSFPYLELALQIFMFVTVVTACFYHFLR